MVNTDDIIDSADKLLHTHRILVRNFERDEKIRNAPKRSLFAKLAKKKAIVLEKGIQEVYGLLKQLSSLVFFDSIGVVVFTIVNFGSHAQMMNLVAFLKDTQLCETVYLICMRKSLDGARKKFVAQRLKFNFSSLKQ